MLLREPIQMCQELAVRYKICTKRMDLDQPTWIDAKSRCLSAVTLVAYPPDERAKARCANIFGNDLWVNSYVEICRRLKDTRNKIIISLHSLYLRGEGRK